MQIAVYKKQEVRFEGVRTYKTKHGQVRVVRVHFSDGSTEEMTEGVFNKHRLEIVATKELHPHGCRRKRIISAVQIAPTRVKVQIETTYYQGVFDEADRVEVETEIYSGCAVLPYAPPVKQKGNVNSTKPAYSC